MSFSISRQLFYGSSVTRRVARIWKRGGGLFWKSEKSANDLDPNFHCPWISVTRFLRKSRRHFSEISEFQTFYLPKFRWSPKKKVFTDFETDFSATIGNPDVFSTQNQVISKKKGLHRFWDSFFGPSPEIQTFVGGLLSYGGNIFNFSQKIDLKTTKKVRFCILHKPMGGLEPPRPPWLRYCLWPVHDCICAHVLFLPSCVHTLGLGLDLGNSLHQRERKSANTQVAKLPKKSVQLILNDTHSVQVKTVDNCLWLFVEYLYFIWQVWGRLPY